MVSPLNSVRNLLALVLKNKLSPEHFAKVRVVGSRELKGVAKERTLPVLIKKKEPYVQKHEQRLTSLESKSIEWITAVRGITHLIEEHNQQEQDLVTMRHRVAHGQVYMGQTVKEVRTSIIKQTRVLMATVGCLLGKKKSIEDDENHQKQKMINWFKMIS